MRYASAFACCWIMAASMSAARGAEDEKPKGDLGEIQGRWTAKVGPDKSIPMVLEIKGDKVTVTLTREGGVDTTLTGRVKLDETKLPKELDFFEFNRPDGQPAEDNLAIYELDGDTLRLCAGGPGNERPEKFEEGKAGDHPRITTLKREEAKGKDEAPK